MIIPGDYIGIQCDCGGYFQEFDCDYSDPEDLELADEPLHTEVRCEHCGKHLDEYERAIKHYVH